MNILIVDDNNDKIARIVSIIKNVSSTFVVDTVLDSISAQLNLKQTKYDLMLLDLLLPLRADKEPVPHGGQLLLKEINRNRSIIPPTIIVGITQFEEHKNNFSSIWKLLLFDDATWEDDLKKIIRHIERSIQFPASVLPQRKPTIIVEGNTDAIILKEAMHLFMPQYIDKLEIKSQKNAGANWVANQVVVWANSLFKDDTGKLIKCIGLLDGDKAGIEANKEINRVVKPDSAGAESFKVIKLNPNYARNMVPIYQKGLMIPITLEELYPPILWEYAKTMDYLDERVIVEELLKDPKRWDKMNETLKEYIERINLAQNEKIYLQTFKLASKEKIVKYIVTLDAKEKAAVLINFKTLVNEIVTYLLL